MAKNINLKKRVGRKAPNQGELRTFYTELMAKPNVIGCFLGRKIKNDKRTGSYSIVCGVNEKVNKEDLSSKERIPKTYKWLETASSYRQIKTDVQKVSLEFEYQNSLNTLGPGDFAVRNADKKIGTIGMAMYTPRYGNVLTTAGHVFPKDALLNDPVKIHSEGQLIDGKMVKREISSDADYALIVCEGDFKEKNIYSAEAIGPLHFPADSDIDKEMFVLKKQEKTKVVCEGVYGEFTWANGRHMKNLVLTTSVTQAGDSGCCLINRKSQICGLLVGVARFNQKYYSIFAPAFIPVQEMKGSLI